MANYDASIRIGTKVDTSQMQRLELQIDKAVQKVEQLQQKQSELRQTQIPTTEYVEIQNQIAKAEANLNKLIEKKERLEATGGGSTSTFNRLNYDIEQAKNTIIYAKSDLDELIASGKAFERVGRNDEYAKVSRELDYAKRNLEALKTKQTEVEAKQRKVTKAFHETANAGKKALKSVGSSSKKATTVIDAFSKRVWGLAKRIFVFSLITRAFRSMVNGIREGVQNFAKYNKEFNATMSSFKSSTAELKNALGVALAPIIQSVVKGLTALVNAFIDCINAYNKFVAVLSGKNTFTVAKKQQIDYAKSLDNTGKSASKTGKELANFDDIEVLNDKSSGAGDLADNLNAEELQSTIKPILEELETLKEKFKKGFDEGKGTKDFEERFNGIKASLQEIKKALAEIWSDPKVKNGAKNLAESTAKAFGKITGAGASIGITLAENVTGGFQKFLERDKESIKESLANIFDINAVTVEMFGNLAKSLARIFEPFGEEAGKSLTSSWYGILSAQFLGSLELASKFARDFVKVIAKPIIDNTEGLRKNFETMLKFLGNIFESIRVSTSHAFSSINKVYDEHFKPFFDDIASGLSKLVGIFSEVFESKIAPVLNSMADGFDTLLNSALMPMFDELAEAVGNIVEILRGLWNNVLVPLLAWLTENLLPVIAQVVGILSASSQGVFEVIATGVTMVTNILNTILRFVSSVFKNGWTKAFEEIGNNFETVWEGMKDTVKTYVNIIIGFVQNMVDRIADGINAIVDYLNEALSFSIPDWVPKYGGRSWSVNLPHVSSVKIPMLAEGAVIPPNRKFLAMLGDQTSGVNIEAPLDTIKQAVSEVVGSGGASNVNIKFTGSLAELGRVLKPVIDAENMRVGTTFEVM